VLLWRDQKQQSLSVQAPLFYTRTNRDKCTISGTLTDQVYYLSPNNFDFADIRHELKEAKKLHQIKQAAVASSIPAPKKKTASFTAFYDRTPSVITGYTKQWVPQLGLVGHFLSEFHMEKIHNVCPDQRASKGIQNTLCLFERKSSLLLKN
jgi:hypothetical protein